MLRKTPYLTPHCETIELASKAALMTASNEGFVVNDNPLFPSSSPFTDDDLFNGLLDL